MLQEREIESRPAVEQRLIDNPLTGFAQWRAEIEEHGAAYAGKVTGQVNLVTALGGFVRFYGTEAQCRACAAYKVIYEGAQLGGAKAVDPSNEPVDGGGANPESVFINGADARRKLAIIDKHLGEKRVKRLRFVLIGEWGPTPFAKHFYHLRVPNTAAVAKAKVEVREIAEALAKFLNLTTKGATPGIRVMAELPTEYFGDVSTRKVSA